MAHVGHISPILDGQSANMAHLGDVSALGGRDSQPMIRIWVESVQPPTGRVVTAEGQHPRRFTGWLDLLGILADAIAADPTEDSGDARPPD